MNEQVNAEIPIIGDPIPTQQELNAQNPVAEETTQVAPEVTEIQDVPNKENPSRFEFWQKKFTEEQQARKALEDKFNEIASRIPKQEAPKEEPLTMPVKPQRPAYYDSVDAFNDPSSESYKYEVAREKYFEDLAEYNQKILEAKLTPFQKAQEEQQQIAEHQQKKAFYVSQLQSVGVTPEKASKIHDFFTSEESLKPENLVIYYDAIEAKKVNPKPEMNNGLNFPLPPGAKGSTNPQLTADDQFNQHMMGWKR